VKLSLVSNPGFLTLLQRLGASTVLLARKWRKLKLGFRHALSLPMLASQTPWQQKEITSSFLLKRKISRALLYLLEKEINK